MYIFKDLNKMIIFYKILIIILASTAIIKKSNCDYWEYKLVHDLYDGYDPSIRPSFHHNSSLNVTFGLALVQIIDVVSFSKNQIKFGLKFPIQDERNMIVTTNCWLNQVILINFKLVILS